MSQKMTFFRLIYNAEQARHISPCAFFILAEKFKGRCALNEALQQRDSFARS
jgi:hypothetical protein